MKTSAPLNNLNHRVAPHTSREMSRARYPSSYEDFEPYFSKTWKIHFVRTFALLAIIAVIAVLAVATS